jgi:Flp pilus assembly pilin Flp
MIIMLFLHSRLRQVSPGDAGATMLEYGFMITGIAAVGGIAAAALGLRVVPMFAGVWP